MKVESRLYPNANQAAQCPWCLDSCSLYMRGDGRLSWVGCFNCGMTGPKGPSTKDAFDRWNELHMALLVQRMVALSFFRATNHAPPAKPYEVAHECLGAEVHDAGSWNHMREEKNFKAAVQHGLSLHATTLRPVRVVHMVSLRRVEREI